MTHSGGKPHAVGDRGQRFQVSATGYPKPEKSVIGWCSTREAANSMRDGISLAPSCVSVEVLDRGTGACIVISYARG